MHTDKNHLSARERISDSLVQRVARNSAFPYEERYSASCACNNTASTQPPAPTRTWGLEGYPLASVYAPLQSWRNIYDEDTGFSKGTIFKELDLPFVCGDRRGGGCRGK